MRRQDEILLLYPGQAPLARKFLLSQVEEMAGAFDSEELLEFLIGQLADDEATVRGQALCSLARFLPGYVRKRYAIASVAAGMWTAYGDGAPGSLTREGVERATQAPMVSKSALTRTWPLVRSMLGSLSELDGWPRTRAVLALGRFGVKPGLDWLMREASSDSPELAAAVALSHMGREETSAALLATIRKHGPEHPDLYLLLADCAGAEAFQIVMDAIPRTTVAGRMNLARALSHFTLDQAGTALKELWARAEGWVGAAALASLEALGHPHAAPVVANLYRTAPHRFLKLQAVKAAGGLRSPDSIAFCREALRDPDPALCAVALESLVRLGLPREDLRSAALPFLSSEHVKARTNAVLATLPANEVLAAPAFRDLLLSGDAISRLEAAYVLGYLRSKQALELLATLAGQDPSPPVRTQAIKSLSRYPAAESVRVLIHLFPSDEARIVLTTARVLGRYENDEAAVVAEGLEEALDAKPRPAVRAVIYKALGMAIRRSRLPHGRNMLAGALCDPEAVVRAGAIEGWLMAGAAANETVLAKLRELADSGDMRQRCRALLALWNSGVLDAPDLLAKHLAAGGDQVAPVLDSALEIGLLLGDVATGTGFPELTNALRDALGDAVAEVPEVLPYRAAWTASPRGAGGVEGPGTPTDDVPAPGLAEATCFKVPAPGGRLTSNADVTMPPGTEEASGNRITPAAHNDVTTPPTTAERAAHEKAAPPVEKSAAARLPPASKPGARGGFGPVSRERSGRVKAPRSRIGVAVGAGELEEFLTSSSLLRQETADVQQDLERVSYVVGHAPSPMNRLRGLLEHPHAKKLFAVPPVLFLVIGLWMMVGGAEELTEAPVPPEARGHLWVSSTSGPTKANDQALKEQDVIKPGTRIVTGPFADLTLDTPVGARITVKSESRVTFDGVGRRKSGPPVYQLQGADGEVVFEFEGRAELELRFGNVKIRSRNVKLGVGKKPDRGTITIIEGDARIESPERQATLKTNARIRIQGQ